MAERNIKLRSYLGDEVPIYRPQQWPLFHRQRERSYGRWIGRSLSTPSHNVLPSTFEQCKRGSRPLVVALRTSLGIGMTIEQAPSQTLGRGRSLGVCF